MEAIASLPLPDPGGVVLGVTPYDLAFPPLAYVVGLSPLGERLGVVSYGRLSPPDHPLGAPPAALALQRLVTAAVHELGHSSGLVHCAVPHCVMHASSAPDHLDLKQPTYCPACDDQLHEASCTADSAEPSGPRRDRQARERA
jgi:archaemetzincin